MRPDTQTPGAHHRNSQPSTALQLSALPLPYVGDANAYACVTCRHVLNVRTVGDVRTFEHAQPTPDGHPPHPVPAETMVDVILKCDFCSDLDPQWSYQFSPARIIIESGANASTGDMGQRWAACRTCARRVEANDTRSLAKRAARSAARNAAPEEELPSAAIDRIATMYRALLSGGRARTPLRPVSAPAATEGTPAHRIRPQMLPKVSTRLAAYWRTRAAADLTDKFATRTHHTMPGHLFPDVPDNVADIELITPDPAAITEYTAMMARHVHQARLYWIDPTYTALADEAARALDELCISAHELPSEYGLTVWSGPIAYPGTTDQFPIIAAQWGPIPGGIWVTFHFPTESLHPGILSDAQLQKIREDDGWLAPVSTGFALKFDTPSTTDNPAAYDMAAHLIATWLLETQDDAEAEDVAPDKAIRKAYQRANRPAPTVRILRLRPTPQPATTPAPTGDKAARRLKHRFWVPGFYRQQPYGPNRSLRERRYVRRHVRGPEGAPWLPTKTVRVLGKTPRAKDQNTD